MSLWQLTLAVLTVIADCIFDFIAMFKEQRTKEFSFQAKVHLNMVRNFRPIS